MTDLERLDSALEWVNRDTPGLLGIHPHILTLAEFATAYRNLVANGERVEWCEKHQAAKSFSKAVRCDVHQIMRWDAAVECSLVSRLLVDPPKEEER